ncbi:MULTISPECIES: SDR family NAD(P)-dependent oxidoreductase [Sphingomonadaceae]|uniref:3-hydroxyacyl-CoA dehydrogenase n=1 Tax=Sphingomonas bisphenolicum TaxID=296544 RepID=A0ABN5WR91_9SPHN|nr:MULTISPECIES: SDR family NAD(P)-dependent oxidoreductase [Sphingomonadaceae]MBZ9649602.1 SDR family NAD(P)-dependent oxidoreductase [Sphingobium sp. 3R8]BBF72122.1 3-hydroxyacyl-CoA dehydrogenase [Sphingomonas bisphenolicum]
MDVQGKTALVTGGASGLGAALVSNLLSAGAHIVVMDICASKLPGVRSILCDITDEAAVASAIAQLGPVSILANMAGIGGIGPIATSAGPGDVAAFRRVIDVNLIGAVNVTAHIAHRMIGNAPDGPDGTRGVILNACSIASFEGQEGMGAYGASKAALAALTLIWARDLSRHAIRCVGIAPGFFATPMTAHMPQALVEELVGGMEFPRRAGTAEEFADAAMFLIRNPMINAEVLRLDGGARPPARTRWTAAA